MPVNSSRRISSFRVLFVLVLTAGLIGALSYGAWLTFANATPKPASLWVTPYVDTTLTPVYHFEEPTEQLSPNVALGFIVADSTDQCAPSWGAFYSLDAGDRALDIQRRIVRLRERGGDAIISFGGAINNELASSCTDQAKLDAAYQSVVDRYALKVIDFDIEGATLGDSAANARRVASIKQLEANNKGLEVWLTIPVAPDGMTAEGVMLVNQLLSGGVDLAGVNVMTMDFGSSKAATMSERDAIASALNNTWRQLDDAYRQAGQPKTEVEVWNHIGVTPMIGQNDIAGEVFSPLDASWLAGFAREKHIGRVSFWSANRDVSCGPNVDDQRASNTCSGVSQEPLQFSETLIGPAPAVDVQPTVAPGLAAAGSTPGTESVRAENLSHDDPLTSPYPVWRSEKTYQAGSKVVWQGRVYEAKWWTQGNQPDAHVDHVWDTPWRYLGPVLDSDRAAIGRPPRRRECGRCG